MRRSEINRLQREALGLFADYRFSLPLFARWNEAAWRAHPAAARYCAKHQMGWDLTDFGSGRFEKRLVVRENQETPCHSHKVKMEDIIVRGGGNLMIEVHNMGEAGGTADTMVSLMVDGVEHQIEAGEPFRLTPGQSVTITRNLWHRFYGELGEGTVFVGEVSQVNDDLTDNYFLETVGRFTTIEEDEPKLFPLWNELASLLQG